jgi:hypothetical protein
MSKKSNHISKKDFKSQNSRLNSIINDRSPDFIQKENSPSLNTTPYAFKAMCDNTERDPKPDEPKQHPNNIRYHHSYSLLIK